MLWLNSPIRRLSIPFFSTFGRGMCHKSVALSKDFSKKTVYQGLSDVELGLCQSQILLVHEAVLNLPCSLTFAIKAFILLMLDRKGYIPRLNIFESFLRNFVRSGSMLCSPNCKKMWRENIHQCVRLWEVRTCFSRTCLHSCLGPTWNSFLYHSFRQSHRSLSDQLSVKPTLIYSVPVSPFVRHLSCCLFFYFLLPS